MGADIKRSQNVWQNMGGQEVGTVWGHGAYVAPDWLHRECTWILDKWSTGQFQKPYNQLRVENQAALQARL